MVRIFRERPRYIRGDPAGGGARPLSGSRTGLHSIRCVNPTLETRCDSSGDHAETGKFFSGNGVRGRKFPCEAGWGEVWSALWNGSISKDYEQIPTLTRPLKPAGYVYKCVYTREIAGRIWPGGISQADVLQCFIDGTPGRSRTCDPRFRKPRPVPTYDPLSTRWQAT